MPAPAPHQRAARRRGIALIEVLIAFALLGLGVAALMRLQGVLRSSTEHTRQRGEALRLAERDLEQLRAFTRLTPGGGGTGPAWSGITAQATTEVGDAGSPTLYRHERAVDGSTAPALKAVSSRLRWTDRRGQPQQVALATLIAGIDPSLVGALMLRRDDGRPGGAFGRHPRIPLSARDLGDGRIAYKPRSSGTLTWLFDARSAQVTARCRSAAGLASADLGTTSLFDCQALSGLLLSGVLRFATQGDTLGAADAENPLGSALDLDLRLTLTSSGHPEPAWECEDDAPEGLPPATTLQTVVHYACVVQPAGSPPRWSGRLDVEPIGWELAETGATGYRVCRYSADHDGNGRIDAREHPRRYSAVNEALGDQNFLVIRAAAACPTDAPAGTGSPANWVDDSTQAHQP